MDKKKILCFGEILWDMLPEGKVLGGAPLNVLYHAKNNGLDGKIISAIGNDELGAEIESTLTSLNVSLDLVQRKQNIPTGIASVSLDENGAASYELVQPVAYDHISLTANNTEAFENCDAFIYGSLANRSEETRNTLKILFNSESENKRILKVFDINLRPPHYEMDNIDWLASQANVIKLNEEELEILSNFKNITGNKPARLRGILNFYKLKAIVCTLGGEGAICITDTEEVVVEGLEVELVDTVGAGDAFLAAFLAAYLYGFSIKDVLKKANEMGAKVAGQKGAIASF